MLKNNFFQIIPIFLVGLLIGSMIMFFLKNTIKKVFNSLFLSKPSIIKKYLVIVFIYIIIFISAYIGTFKLTKPENINNVLNIVNQALTSILAIMAGYLAYIQVVENRVSRLKEEADYKFASKCYTRAIKLHEEIHSIDKKDFSVFAELMELYLINGDFDLFNNNIENLKKVIIEKSEKIIFYYLLISNSILQEKILEAKNKIKDLINENKELNKKVYWSFIDIKENSIDAQRGKQFSPECIKLFNNLIKYLTKQMTDEDIAEFENGNYLIDTKIMPLSNLIINKNDDKPLFIKGPDGKFFRLIKKNDADNCNTPKNEKLKNLIEHEIDNQINKINNNNKK